MIAFLFLCRLDSIKLALGTQFCEHKNDSDPLLQTINDWLLGSRVNVFNHMSAQWNHPGLSHTQKLRFAGFEMWSVHRNF